MSSSLQQLQALGQSVWLDYIRRDMICDGALRAMIEQDGVSGVTSNPAIFEQAIARTTLYDEAIRALACDDPLEIYETLAIEDVRAACDVFAPVYERTGGKDGFVSLEVSPRLAHDTEGTLVEARRLFAAVDRPNVMIKVPATTAGLPAIETLIYEGLNVNVTLIFSQAAYVAVAEAYLKGLERRAQEEKPLRDSSSVASVFVSRIDTLFDALLQQLACDNASLQQRVQTLLGAVGIANLKLVYKRYEALFGGERFAALAAAGATPQRPLWASTSTKNPAYPDVLYVEALIGPHTVNTLPPGTLDAFRDHGVARETLTEGVDQAEALFAQLEALGVDSEGAMAQLLEEGVRKFVEPFEHLLDSVAQKRVSLATS